MLNLKEIVKVYQPGDVVALHGISLAFRQNEFVSILGPSGCGKTTLLNIIGGLDRYTSGEMTIRRRPTAEFSDRDWDTYRNHSIGFVFQSYNLIPHQTVLSNVELALTLSGVSKSERSRRAISALEAVGLGDQLKKKPSQMSGGQMQRVAIARALVNDPDILLADEPTGALDSETSVQVMDILKEVAKSKLVIMVTHNPDLAERYSTRIIRLLDGRVLEDTNPYTTEEEEKENYSEESAGESGVKSAEAGTGSKGTAASSSKRRKNRTSMSFATALSLSLNNLMTKKGRTFLTAFAGSIGIIGIATILSLSNGINLYIDKVQEDALSAYPITIERETVDMTSLISAMTEASATLDEEVEEGVIRSNTMMYDLLDSMTQAEVQENNLSDFIDYIDSHGGDLDGYASAITYGYDVPLYIYSTDLKDEDGLPVQLNPSVMFMSALGVDSMSDDIASDLTSYSSMMSVEIWDEMPENLDLIRSQYDVIAGRLPESYDEVVLIVDEQNRINDIYLYALGFKDPSELSTMVEALMKGEEFAALSEEFTYDDFLDHEFALLYSSDFYKKSEDGWDYVGSSEADMNLAVDSAERVKIVGIIRPNAESAAVALTGAIGYLPDLMEHVMAHADSAEIVKEQKEDPTVDVLSGLPFETDENSPDNMSEAEKAAVIRETLGDLTDAEASAAYTKYMSDIPDEKAEEMAVETMSSMQPEQAREMVIQALAQSQSADEGTISAYLDTLSDEEYSGIALKVFTAAAKQQAEAEAETALSSYTASEMAEMLDLLVDSLGDSEVVSSFAEYMPEVVSKSTYEDNLTSFGCADLSKPAYIEIYASTFEAKDEISRLITEYNADKSAAGEEESMIRYTDYVALMMSSISTIINVISYVLIAFVSISLVVSSIMIGIITYISVLERVKEIGILRAIGASKRDISRVFNAETLIIGFVSGGIGILVTLLICIPVNIIIKSLTDISGLAQLPIVGGVVLVCISMLLTVIAGLIPSRIAAKKDPVEALRNE